MSDSQNPEISSFVLYGLGRAANNKALNSRELEITPIEQLSMLDGELVSLPFDSEVSGERADGSSYTSKVMLNAALTAMWLPLGTHRRMPPDIRRGERVFIYRYADTDQYYWKETGWDDHLRRLETVHLRISATPEQDADMDDPSNYYHLAISSHDKLIHLETSRANGEVAKYALQFNLAEGVVALSDDHGNFCQLESVAKIWSMQNGDGTLWQLKKKEIYGYAPDKMHVIAENKIHFQTKDFLLETQTGNIEASTSFKIKTPKFDVESDTNTFTTPNSTFTGNVTVAMNLTISGSLSQGGGGGGSAMFASPAQFQQPVQFQTQVTANGITSSAPITGPRGSI